MRKRGKTQTYLEIKLGNGNLEEGKFSQMFSQTHLLLQHIWVPLPMT